jgi:UDP-3-O-[3-hydroxymyristoyl] glucosamine N-acyltransferase
MKLQEIAAHLGGELYGDGDLEIVGVNRIEDAGSDQITFVANPKYIKHLSTTKAGAVIVSKRDETIAVGQLVAADPMYAFARVLRLLYPESANDIESGVAATALVDSSAKLGSDVHVGNFACIGENARLGDRSKVMASAYVGRNCSIGADSIIYPNVTIYDNAMIGNRVTVHAGTVIGSDGFGYAQHEGVHHKILQIGTVRIEDDVEIGSNCTIDRAAIGETVIGEGTKIDNLVQIAHNVKIGRGCIIVSQVGVSGSTKLGDYVTLAGQVGLVGHIEIGDRAILAAQAGVPKDVPADAIFAGSPARELMEFKRIEAHVHRLPQKMKLLQELADEVAALKKRIEELEER